MRWLCVASLIVGALVLIAGGYVLGAADQAALQLSVGWWAALVAVVGGVTAIGFATFGLARSTGSQPIAETRFDGADGSRLTVRFVGSVTPTSAHELFSRAHAVLGPDPRTQDVPRSVNTRI